METGRTLQNRRIGDESDFLKFGFLRTLLGLTDRDKVRMTTGVNWYVTCACPGPSLDRRLDELPDYRYLDDDLNRDLDPFLFNALRSITKRLRTLSPVTGGVLEGKLSGSFDRVLYDIDRDDWHLDALGTVGACDTVFLDPDTGLQPSTCGTEHVSTVELGDYLDGSNVVLHQHLRGGGHDGTFESVQEQVAELDIVDPDDMVGIARGGTMLIVMPTEEHRDRLHGRVEQFLDDWTGFVTAAPGWKTVAAA